MISSIFQTSSTADESTSSTPLASFTGTTSVSLTFPTTSSFSGLLNSTISFSSVHYSSFSSSAVSSTGSGSPISASSYFSKVQPSALSNETSTTHRLQLTNASPSANVITTIICTEIVVNSGIVETTTQTSTLTLTACAKCVTENYSPLISSAPNAFSTTVLDPILMSITETRTLKPVEFSVINGKATTPRSIITLITSTNNPASTWLPQIGSLGDISYSGLSLFSVSEDRLNTDYPRSGSSRDKQTQPTVSTTLHPTLETAALPSITTTPTKQHIEQTNFADKSMLSASSALSVAIGGLFVFLAMMA